MVESGAAPHGQLLSRPRRRRLQRLGRQPLGQELDFQPWSNRMSAF